MKILHNGASPAMVASPALPASFAVTPVARAFTQPGLPQPWLQIQHLGVNVGDDPPEVLDFVLDPAAILVTRGVGESAHVVTLGRASSLPDPTTLLLHGDGANGATVFPDNSGYNRTVTNPSGAVTVSTAQSKFGGASILFSKAGNSSIQVANAPRLLNFFSYDFTIEFWCFNQDNLNQWMASSHTSANQIGWGIYRIVDGITPNGALAFGSGGVPEIKSADGSFQIDTWHHVAVTRKAGVVKLWLNGALVGSITSNARATSQEQWPIYFGAQFNAGSIGNYYQGYLDEIRVLVGLAAYDAPFTSPTTAFQNIPTRPDPIENQYVSTLLFALHADGVDGSTFFPDDGPNRIDAAAVGSAQVDTTNPKIGDASCAVAAGDHLTIGTSPLNLKTTDFTVEAFIKVSSDPGNFTIISGNAGGASDDFYVERLAGNWYVGDGLFNNIGPVADASFTSNVWHHIAVVKDGTNYYLFRNGTIIGSSSTLLKDTGIVQFVIGARRLISLPLNGNIDEIMFTLEAKYTSAFTPETIDFIPHTTWPPSP